MENTEETTTTRGRYVGPTAARIAELIAPQQRVRFERGWFWTAAVCHDSEQDRLAFRQRPDGEGIDVRCQRADNEDRCSRERAIRQLETLTGESIWSAYAAQGIRPRNKSLLAKLLRVVRTGVSCCCPSCSCCWPCRLLSATTSRSWR